MSKKTSSSPASNRKFEDYYQGQLLLMESVVRVLLDGIARAIDRVDDNDLAALLMVGDMAYSKAIDAAHEVGQYIQDLEKKLDESTLEPR